MPKPNSSFSWLYSQSEVLNESTCLAKLTEHHTENYLQVMHDLQEYFSRLHIQHMAPPPSWQSDNRQESQHTPSLIGI